MALEVEEIDAPDNADGLTIDAEPLDNPRVLPDQPLVVSKRDAATQFSILSGWLRGDMDHSRAWRSDARFWFAFRAGEQWNDDDKALLELQQRPVIVFNRVLTILKAVAGMEINGRHEIQFLPVGTEDTKVNEVLSGASMWMANSCDAEDEESEAFDDTCTCGMGWCLSDDALVRLPNTHFATTRLYSGSVVEIGLENGKQLTGTPNHPVLTDRGWKRLHELREGDNLINSAFMERVQGLPVEQFDKVETRLKDKIDAFRTGRESLRLATAPDDFYADGAGSKVHVVYADGLLLDQVRKFLRGRERHEPRLSWRNYLAPVRAALSGKRLIGRAIYAAVCQAAFDCIHAPLAMLAGHHVVAQGVAGVAEASADGFRVQSETIANFGGGQIVHEVEPDKLLGCHDRGRASAPRFHLMPGALEPQANGGHGYSNLIADFFDWKPLLEIEARKLRSGDRGVSQFVTRVKSRIVRPVENFAVHDVGTSLGFFVAGDVITSNTESRMSYEDDPAGMYVEEQVDPLEMYWDRTAKKKNLHDSRRRARVRRMPFSDARDMFPGFTRLQIDAVWAQDALGEYPLKSQEEKWRRDDDTGLGPDYDDNCEVTIVQIQWIEREIYWLVADTATQSKVELSDAEYKRFADRMGKLGMQVHAARLTRKVYKQAFLGAQGVMLKKAGPAPLGKFTWDCITGEADKSKRSWFGLVKLLRDPQIWANKWLSQILHILNTTAKGGIIAELDAFDDEREAEESYAQPEAITWAASGAISGNKIMAKPGTAMTEGYVGLLAFAVSSFKDVSGINLELLGQQDQNQPGVLEAMRKQAGMTVLATLFDSLRRYRKNVGRSRLYCIQNFMSDGRLVRVVAQGDGREIIQAVRLAKEKTTGKYDVIVDDAPTSPNQKEANWAIIQPLLVVFKEQLMANPAVLGMLLEYSPLPSRIVEAVKAFISQAQDDPAAQQKRAEQEQIAKAAAMALIDKDVSIAELNRAKVQGTASDAAYNMAVAQNLLSDNKFEELKQHIAMMEAQAKGEESQSKIALNISKADRERVGAHVDAENVRLKRDELAKNAQGESIGRLIESMTARAGADRDRAATHLDYVKADKEARTPIERPAAAK